jgi:hypothetical protein
MVASGLSSSRKAPAFKAGQAGSAFLVRRAALWQAASKKASALGWGRVLCEDGSATVDEDGRYCFAVAL